MGRGGNAHNSKEGRSRKSKGRMSYLRRFRKGRGGGGGEREAKVDELGQKFGDYVPSYGGGGAKRNFGGRRDKLRCGMKGFLCTTNFKENECVREAYNILNEFCEDTEETPKKVEEGLEDKGATGTVETEKELPKDVDSESKLSSGGDPVASAVKKEKDQDDEDEDDDIDKALSNELKNLRSEKSVMKFQRADTGVSNVVFISTTIENPTELAYRIFEDVSTKKQTKSRFLLRLLPIELTCNANNADEVKSKAKEVIEKYMKEGYLSFRIVANIRLNGKLQRDDLIKTLAELVPQINPLTYVDLNNAQYTIVAEVLKTTLCLGIVKDFTKFKKYNLLEAGTTKTPVQDSSSKSNAESAVATAETEPVAAKMEVEGQEHLSEGNETGSAVTAMEETSVKVEKQENPPTVAAELI